VSAATPLRELAIQERTAESDGATRRAEAPVEVTLLELVKAVSDVSDSELEVVATVVHMLRSGSVRLRGNFKGQIIDC
jgi:hypothetical protein